MKHTQLPWHIEHLIGRDEETVEVNICTEDGYWVLTCGDEGEPNAEENAEFIVTACNNYHNFMELLDATKMFLAGAHDRDECYDEITGEMFDDFKALTDAIDKCEGRGR